MIHILKKEPSDMKDEVWKLTLYDDKTKKVTKVTTQ